jgi:hypothetical protein
VAKGVSESMILAWDSPLVDSRGKVKARRDEWIGRVRASKRPSLAPPLPHSCSDALAWCVHRCVHGRQEM